MANRGEFEGVTLNDNDLYSYIKAVGLEKNSQKLDYHELKFLSKKIEEKYCKKYPNVKIGDPQDNSFIDQIKKSCQMNNSSKSKDIPIVKNEDDKKKLESMQTDNIVILFDGTNQDKKDRSNISKLWDLLKELHKVVYVPGVGKGRSLCNPINIPIVIDQQAEGLGISKKLKEGYRGLCQKIKELKDYNKEWNHPKIFVFGFSRGAFTAISFVNMLRICGLPDENDLKDLDLKPKISCLCHCCKGVEDKFFNKKLNKYKNNLDHPNLLSKPVDLSLYEQDKKGEDKKKNIQAKVKFLGLFDSVSTVLRKNAYDSTYVSNCEQVLHLCSIQEHRLMFLPHRPIFEDDKTVKERSKTIWFLGNHSDVGGAIRKNKKILDLSLITLSEMLHKSDLCYDESEYKKIFDSFLNQEKMEEYAKKIDHPLNLNTIKKNKHDTIVHDNTPNLLWKGVADFLKFFQFQYHKSIVDRKIFKIDKIHDSVWIIWQLEKFRICSESKTLKNKENSNTDVPKKKISKNNTDHNKIMRKCLQKMDNIVQKMAILRLSKEKIEQKPEKIAKHYQKIQDEIAKLNFDEYTNSLNTDTCQDVKRIEVLKEAKSKMDRRNKELEKKLKNELFLKKMGGRRMRSLLNYLIEENEPTKVEKSKQVDTVSSENQEQVIEVKEKLKNEH